ncbi:MAG: TetR/AcrR family transcriptional regulator [Nitrospirota bacterium]|nr:TetR/AcrR family transcriptional regulator [Nitrospirota bacterium]
MTKTILTKKTGAGRRPRKNLAVIDSRVAILTSARGVFAQKGYDGTTMREVSSAAGVNNAMIYYHFKDKQELYRAVLLDSFSALESIWEKEIFRQDVPVREKIRVYVDELIRFHLANEDLRRIIFREFNVCSENCRWMADKLFSKTFKRLAALLQEGGRRGEIRPCDPAFAVPAIVGMVTHIFMVHPVAEHISGKQLIITPSRLGAFVTDLFFDGLGITKSDNSAEKRKL